MKSLAVRPFLCAAVLAALVSLFSCVLPLDYDWRGLSWVYVPAEGRWHEVTRAVEHFHPGSALARCQGTLLQVTGRNAYGYDIARDAWHVRTRPPMDQGFGHASVHDGRLYVLGSIEPRSRMPDRILRYDPALDTWSQGAWTPLPLQGRACAAAEGRVYLFGGEERSGGTVHYGRSVHAYDTASDAWTTLSSLPWGLSRAAAAAFGGRIYLLGGLTGEPGADRRTVLRFDPQTGAFTRLADAPWDLSPLYNEGDAADQPPPAVRLGSFVYLAERFDRLLRYDPAAGSWTAVGSFDASAHPVWAFGAAALEDRLYLFGGSQVPE